MNTARDAQIAQALTSLGWRVSTIWECETKNPEVLAERLRDAFRSLGDDHEKE